MLPVEPAAIPRATLTAVLVIVLGTVAAVAAIWASFLVVVVIASVRTRGTAPSVRLLPDTVRLLRRLATDPGVPRGSRLLVWALLAYLACPIDLVPDFLPLVGYADDVVLAAVVTRRIVRRAGPEVVARHWPGTPDDLRLLCRILHVPSPA